jgi:hypothetical protein
MLSQSQKDLYLELYSRLSAWANLGRRVYPGGTERIGHIPRTAPEGYLHSLFPPLSPEDIDNLEVALNKKLPKNFRQFLLIHNGIEVFDQIKFYGSRKGPNKRGDIDAMMELPLSILTPNNRERPERAPSDIVFIGSFGPERRLIGMRPDGQIGLWNEASAKLDDTGFSDILGFLLAQTKKAECLFDAEGYKKK